MVNWRQRPPSFASRRRFAKSRLGQASKIALGSLAVLAVLILLLSRLGSLFSTPVDESHELFVYCASGVKPAVEPIARDYEREFGVTIRLQPGSSGVLEQQLLQSKLGDLYIPAGVEPFLARGRRKKYIDEILPIAQFRLVLVVQPGNPKKIESLDDLLRGDVDVVIAAKPAAVGKTTREVLADWHGYDQLIAKATTKPTVTEVAGDVRIGVRADAGFIWDATARQVELEIVPSDELKQHPMSVSTIGAGVLASTKQPTAAIRFARYMSSPEKGQKSFAALHYTLVDGDAWALTPKLSLFSGGVNRVAIEQTLAEFQEREGCELTTTFQGCGSLVTMMQAGQLPDAYFACDVSFVDQVASQFQRPVTVSETEMVMLVQPGNPKQIRTLRDLGSQGIRVGLADEQLTALGRLSVQLLKRVGVYDAVIANRCATTPTADMLVAQLLTVNELDAAIVYRANCNYIGTEAEIVPIDEPAARALQPIAIQRQTKHPQLADRLMEAILSTRSRRRFEQSGFRWEHATSSDE